MRKAKWTTERKKRPPVVHVTLTTREDHRVEDDSQEKEETQNIGRDEG